LRSRELSAAAALLAAVLLLLLPMALQGVGIFDEGFIASGAMMILRGDLPLRDFYVVYGPGQYYLSAGLMALFGESLLVTRVAHVLLLAGLAATVAAASYQLVHGRIRLVLLPVSAFLLMTVNFLPNPGYPAVPAVLLLMLATWPVAHWAKTGSMQSLLGASLLIGVAGLLRWDFAVLGFGAQIVAVSLVQRARGASLRDFWRTLTRLVLPGALLVIAGFAPFLLAAGPDRWFREVPLFMALEFKQWRNLDVLGPTLTTLSTAWAQRDRWAMLEALLRLVYAATPFIFASGALLLAGTRVWRQRGLVGFQDALALGLSLLSLAMLNQVRVRAAVPQAYPAFVAALPLIVYLLTALAANRRARFAAWAVTAGVMIVWLALPAYFAQGKLRTLPTQSAQVFALPRAGLVLEGPHERLLKRASDYTNLIRFLQTSTAPNDYIFSGVTDTSRLFINDSLLYFLANRRPATRWVEMEPGLSNTVAGQNELIQALQTKQVKTVVLLQMLSEEPNATARSNGVHLLDDFIRSNFQPQRQFGKYTVLERSQAVATLSGK
jgi:hypothetical protein